ncbi:Hypothetical predicted protein [Podarcis lilfordi]|uniref:Uncharacterized protein n=1 Tax=Podarcis lilfordi TaxID=74358 RepID=A0AA35P6V0_9SAUR|nr:Hypothetical predicted protein [Podarcis lilfordi]
MRDLPHPNSRDLLSSFHHADSPSVLLNVNNDKQKFKKHSEEQHKAKFSDIHRHRKAKPRAIRTNISRHLGAQGCNPAFLPTGQHGQKLTLPDPKVDTKKQRLEKSTSICYSQGVKKVHPDC